MTAALGAQEPTLVEVQGAITLHAGQAIRYSYGWKNYDWTHEQINELLDERDRILNQMCAEAIVLSAKRKANRERWWRGVGA